MNRPPPTRREVAGFMFMVAGMFMAILDIQIVSASIAEIQAGLAASPDEAAWVQTSYLIAEIVMIPLSGFLSRAMSTRLFYVASALGFTMASALCATATSLTEMIVFRALQGFLGGGMIPTVFATAFLIFPPARVGQMSVLIGLTATMAPTIGPTLGGWLTDTLSWHWLFLINLPVGLAVAVFVGLLIRIDRPEPGLLRRFDLAGLLLMAAFLGSLEYVLEEGVRNDWFEDATITTFAVIAALAAVLFFWRMLTRRDPLVDLGAFRNRNFALGCLFSSLIGVGLYGLVYLLPLFLGRVRGYDSMQIGQTVWVTGVAQFIAAPIAGQLVRRLDKRIMLAGGLTMFGLSCWWLSRLTSQSAFWELFGPQVLRGLALMFLFVPVNALALGTLAPAALKNASGLYNLMRNLGGAVGIAAIGTLATTRGAVHTLHLQEQVTWARPAATDALAGMARALTASHEVSAHLAALRRLALLVEREAMTLAYNDVLLLLALCFFAAVPMTLLLAPPRPAGPAGH